MSTDTRTVFVLGAGASADARVPLMRNFLEKAMLIEHPPRLAEAFRLVAKARSRLQLAQSKARFDIRNVESVFAAFEMAELFGQLADLSKSELQQLVGAMRSVIVFTVEHYMMVPIINQQLAPPPRYDEFGALLKTLRDNGHMVSVLTFNYDIGIEMGLWMAGMDADYCLPDSNEPRADQIELMKLHGSVNWANCAQCRAIYPKLIRDIARDEEPRWKPSLEDTFLAKSTQLHVGRTLESINCQKCFCPCKPEPAIIPPTASKSGLHRDFQTVWQRAAKRLSEASNIFIIGYSWPDGDHFFQQLYALGTIGDTVLSRFWVCDPDPQVRLKFRQKLLGEQARDCYGPRSNEETDFRFRGAISKIAKEFKLGRIEVRDRDGRFVRDLH